MTLEVKFLSKFESIFKTALAHESADQFATFCEIALDKKISCYSPFKGQRGPTQKMKVIIGRFNISNFKKSLSRESTKRFFCRRFFIDLFTPLSLTSVFF
jgi:hypothetical protein